MKNYLFILSVLLATVFVIGCQKEAITPQAAQSQPEVQELFSPCPIPIKSHNVQFTPGDTVRNTIIIDGESREYLIYVPRFYDAWWTQSYAYPVVFMFHGNGQNAVRMADGNITGWSALSETENFIVIYPKGWYYDMLSGSQENRFATANSVTKIAATEHLRDDVKFIKSIRKGLLKKLRTNCERYYACGFSNGGSFVKTEVKINMDDLFAATTSCGGIGLQVPLTPAHGMQRPHFEVVGENDGPVFDKFYTPGPTNVPVNCGNWDTEPFYYVLENMATTMGFTTGPACFFNNTSNLSMYLWGSFWAPGLAYRFRMIPNMGHKYPGTDTQKDFTIDFWNFLEGYTL